MEGLWQVVEAEEAEGNYCFGMGEVDSFSVLWLGIPVTYLPSHGVLKEISWSALV
jgi:hypothetical protein